MNISKCIKMKLVSSLAKLEFKYEKDGPLWLFTREVDGFIETIQLDKGKWEQKGIRLEYIKEGQTINSHMFIDPSSVEQYYYYKDAESLEKLMDTFIEITKEYGLSWFEQVTPKNTFPEENYLEENWKHKTQIFMIQNNLDYSEESIQKLEELLEENHSTDHFFCASRYVGEYLVNQFAAKWGMDRNYGPYVDHIGGSKTFKRYPHQMIEYSLESHHATSVLEHIQIIKNLV
ncbi:hypothetical protein [Paenibacillus dauci]|uniref:hypothetical protein n=1 Tax=Paenibacillus dauci TaxID=1567106 RepID=UPI000619ABCB|nr:hypothetical protein [Paenibacillus dauci]